ncbi:hypothetical protein cypCar_00036531 [Cyprinus carpio]|nr:hypothetical protein cypCar_00036531 [Cyprinus carpio]
MKAVEFDMNKNFIKDVMKKLSNSSIKFAAVQFSTEIRTVFDFNDYQNGSAEEKLMKERHMKSLTNTYKAINYVLKNVLNSVSSGADPNAQKALVIITDGDPSDNDDYNILNICDEQNILRYIIGVGKVDLTTLTQLAAEPKLNNTFYIQEYNGLKGLLDNLQKKIYNIEGSKEAHGRDRQKELSQSGFSVVYQEPLRTAPSPPEISYSTRPSPPERISYSTGPLSLLRMSATAQDPPSSEESLQHRTVSPGNSYTAQDRSP